MQDGAGILRVGIEVGQQVVRHEPEGKLFVFSLSHFDENVRLGEVTFNLYRVDGVDVALETERN